MRQCRNVKVIHCNQFFLVATPRGDAMPLGESESTSGKGATQSTFSGAYSTRVGE